MDKYLKPARFDTNPNSSTAAKEWIHWHKTLMNFIEILPIPEETTVERQSILKLNTLHNFLDYAVFEYISGCTNFEDAISILNSVYVKPKNTVYARHLLATRKQQNTETIDEYLQALKTLSRDCDFQNVTAQVYCDELVQDSFINGL